MRTSQFPNIDPNIDPRIHAVGVSKLREMNANFLKKIGVEVYLIQERDEPIAVLVGYDSYLLCQQLAKEGGAK